MKKKLQRPLSLISNVQSNLKYLESILESIPHKPGEVEYLVQIAKDTIKQIKKRKDNISPMISLLASMNAVSKYSLYFEYMQKATTVALDIMKKLGAHPLQTEKGGIFDPQIHYAVEVKNVDLPDGTILDVLSPGFRLDEEIYCAKVIVARNIKEKESVKCPDKEKFDKKLDWPCHSEYQDKVRQNLIPLIKDPEVVEWMQKHETEVWSVFNLDLGPIRTLIISLYSKDKRGHPPCDPFAIFRSLLLMYLLKKTRVTPWASEVKVSRVLSILCGFNPGQAPAVGTYYEFFKRLENGPYERKCKHRILPSEIRHATRPYRMPNHKPKEKPKREPEKEGVLDKLVAELKKHENEPLPNDLEKLLNVILNEVAIKPSISKNLLGDIQKLVFSGDGSVIPSSAAPNGSPTCDCRKKKIYRCDHLRKFSDIWAQWGWDNELEDFVFGYRYYQLVCGSQKHDLPLYVSIASANTHEAVMSLKLLDRFIKQCQKLMPCVKLDKASFDAIHDAYAFYGYLVYKHIQYAIPYAKEPSQCIRLGEKGILVNQKGVPICEAGLTMRYHYTTKNGAHVYACPVKKPTHRNGKYVYVCHREQCPREALCEPLSTMGPLVRIPHTLDPRIHPQIPRESQEYKTLLDSRTCCERSNSAKKHTYLMKFTNTRTMPYAFIRLMLISILEHVRAWILEEKAQAGNTKTNILEKLGLQTNR